MAMDQSRREPWDNRTSSTVPTKAGIPSPVSETPNMPNGPTMSLGGGSGGANGVIRPFVSISTLAPPTGA